MATESGRVAEATGLSQAEPQSAQSLVPPGFDPSREETMFLDTAGTMIRLGDVIRAPISINQGVHGTWGEYRIRKAPGGYLLSYLRSEKGQILPEGYTGGYMSECIPEDDETDIKTLVFTQVPLRINGWQIISDRDAAPRKAEGFEAAGQQPGPERSEGIAQKDQS